VTVERMFEAAGDRLMADGDGVERGRMLRSLGLKADGRFFAFARDDELTVRIAPARVSELIAAGEGQPFRSGSRTMKGWVTVAPAAEAALETYLEEARAWTARPSRPRAAAAVRSRRSPRPPAARRP
jgi:hypothetical protein